MSGQDRRCWIGASIEMPGGQKSSWRCENNATRAVKVRSDSLQAWAVQKMEVTYTPVCPEHFTEMESRVEDWQTMEEWREWLARARARSGR